MVYDHYSAPLSKLDIDLLSYIPPGGNWRDLPSDFPSARIKQIRENYSKGGGSRSTYYGRLCWDRPAYTISTYFNRPGNGCFIHPEGVRLLSLREGARIQTFPDGYRFTGPIRSRYAQIGNALPPLAAYYVANMLPKGAVVDLFCGAGGLSLGFEWAGFSTILAVDNDSHALNTFSINRSGRERITINADLSNLEGIAKVIEIARCRLANQPLTILIGGPPCQGFSTAGNSELNDPRNRLLQSFIEVADGLSPAYILVENVSALLWRSRNIFLSEFREALHKRGYVTSIILAHTETFGVPQLRRRMLLLGSRSTKSLCWPTSTHKMLQPCYPKYQKQCEIDCKPARTLADAISDLPLQVANDPDESVFYGNDPKSDYQSWARGDLSLNEIAPLVSHFSVID